MLRITMAISTLLLVLFFWAAPACTQTVRLPLTIDHALLTALVAQQAFSEKGQSVTLSSGLQDCTYVRLSEPRFSGENGLLRLEVKLFLRAGTPLGGECFVPLEWQGYIELLQRPVLDPQHFTLSFKTVDSTMYTLSREPAPVVGFFWDLATPRVYEYLARIRIDLTPPVRDLRSFLTSIFNSESSTVGRALLDSLRGGSVGVHGEGVTIDLQAETGEVFMHPQEQAPLSGKQREQLIELWETWDAFLVKLLVSMARTPLSEDDHQLLVEILLDTRHLFTEGLAEASIEKDFVRNQFITTWSKLSPVFRRQLYAEPSLNSLGYLAFFTAADALAVLDRLGPAFGVEISQEGLLRLAAMLEGERIDLPYSPDIDLRLRELLELPLRPEILEPDSKSALPPGEKRLDGTGSLFSNFFFTPAYGAELPSLGEILQWKVPTDNYNDYVQRVRNVLANGRTEALAKKRIPQSLHNMFGYLIDAMAWQESCFRQFVVKGDNLTYLLSYNQTSVGVMQINERVWRGIYNRDRLRWDIAYNALAGCEIAELYLYRYALRPLAGSVLPDPELLGRAVYAMYNGGPSQFKKFMSRDRADNHYQSDILFLEKFKWVKSGGWDQLGKCFVGG